MFPHLPARATFVADTNLVSGTQKMFLILFRNTLCPQQMFPSLCSPRNIMGNNVSATMCPRLPGPLEDEHTKKYQNTQSPSLPPGKGPQNSGDIFAVKKSKQSAMRYTVKICLKESVQLVNSTTTPTSSYSKIFVIVVSLLSEVHFVANYQERSIVHVMTNFWDP